MIYTLSLGIAFYFVKNGFVKEEDLDLYRYGIEVIICSVVDVLIVMLSGMLFKSFWKAIGYYVVFCKLRNWFDGYHAKTFLGCKTMMIAMMCVVLTISKVTNLHINIGLLLIGLSIMGILWVENNINDSQKRIGLGYILIEMVLLIYEQDIVTLMILAYIITLTSWRFKIKN